jgi:hypothetical protein
VVETGSLFIISSIALHQVAVSGSTATVLDVFSPIREDYAAQMNRFISTTSDATNDAL